MEKLSMPQIIGKMSATQGIIAMELRAVLRTHEGQAIPAYLIEDILENLQQRIKEDDQAWENRA